MSPTFPPVTVATLAAINDAWNRYDIDTLMSLMTDDGIFQTTVGPDACGTRHAGADAVRKAFIAAWTTVSNAQWINAKHFVHGDIGTSQWTLVGTAADGSRVEVDGVDLFTFRDGKVYLKNTFRKTRVNPAMAQ